jgi:hypothetical protein
MKRIVLLPRHLLLALALLLATVAVSLAANAVIDFEGLPAGTIVTSLSSGSGISGDVVVGAVEVLADGTPRETAAVVFDAVCGGAPANCSGGDDDLYAPNLGKVLIIAEDLVDANNDGLVDDPDDADATGGFFTFDFTGFGPGTVTVDSLDVLDVEVGNGHSSRDHSDT